METIVRKQTLGSVRNHTTDPNEPRKLSKFGKWRRENPGGIFIIHERRKANA